MEKVMPVMSPTGAWSTQNVPLEIGQRLLHQVVPFSLTQQINETPWRLCFTELVSVESAEQLHVHPPGGELCGSSSLFM